MKSIGPKKPLYKYVQDEILDLIKNWDIAKPIPSEAILSKDMGVSRNTVREAIQNLEKSDVLIKKHGVGTFINNQSINIVTTLNNLHGIQKILETEGKTLNFKQNEMSISILDYEISSFMKLEKGQEVLQIIQTYLADDTEIIKGICYINPDIYENNSTSFLEKIKGSNDTKTSIFEIIKQNTNYEIDHAITKISAIPADEDTARSLSIKPYKPIIKLDETYFDKEGKVLMHSVDLMDSDRFQLLVVRKRIL